jgi:hypothetical protein
MPQGQSPTVIEILPSDTAQTIASKITPDSKPVLILMGEYAASLNASVRSLCIRGLLPMAIDAECILVDDGASSGCSADLGASSLESDKPPTLVGVVATGAEFDTNHGFVVKLAAPGADALQWSFQLGSAVAKCDEPGHKSVALMVIGGSDREKSAIVRAARKGWPIVLITGAGGITDAIATALQPQADGSPAPTPADPVIREILETGSIYTFKVTEDIDDLKRILSAQLRKSLEGLETAWEWYEDLDKAALDRQKTFRDTQNLLLRLGVAATLLAILSAGKLPQWVTNQQLIAFAQANGKAYHNVLWFLLIVVPIVITLLTAWNNRFRAGNKWILLRAAAESIKREIYQFRARAGAYSDSQCTLISRSSKLAAKVKDITQGLVQSEVNKSAITHQPPGGANRLTFLSAEDYVKERLKDQIDYYTSKTKKLNAQLHQLNDVILLAGAAGTLVAAVGWGVWVALTTALATAFTAKLEIDQTENSLVQYNIALTGLRNIESWWNSLSPWEKSRPRNIDLLVEQTENVLAGEMAGWVQQMQSALDKLAEKQEKEQQAQAPGQ